MPIYEYECTKCGKRFEYTQKMSEPPKKKCEKCSGKLQKLISSSGFILKGGGWYKDLYSSKKPVSSETKSDSKPDSKTESKTDSKTESKSESKSEAKAESKPDKPAKKEKK